MPGSMNDQSPYAAKITESHGWDQTQDFLVIVLTRLWVFVIDVQEDVVGHRDRDVPDAVAGTEALESGAERIFGPSPPQVDGCNPAEFPVEPDVVVKDVVGDI